MIILNHWVTSPLKVNNSPSFVTCPVYNPLGYRVHPNLTATLHRWYSLMREKRAVRQDFLKSIVKVFDIEQTNQVSQVSAGPTILDCFPALTLLQSALFFTRYMAENLSAMDYKTQEEVLTIIKHLTAVLSTSGTHIVESICPSHLLAQLRENNSATVNANNVRHKPILPFEVLIFSARYLHPKRPHCPQFRPG